MDVPYILFEMLQSYLQNKRDGIFRGRFVLTVIKENTKQ